MELLCWYKIRSALYVSLFLDDLRFRDLESVFTSYHHLEKMRILFVNHSCGFLTNDCKWSRVVDR